jgi:hypothetical protein
MKKFLVTYHGGSPPANPEQAKHMKEAFMAWLGTAGAAVADPGAPVHAAGHVAHGKAHAQVEIGGYSIIQAETVDAARAVLASHPFVARGGTLQLFEFVAI